MEGAAFVYPSRLQAEGSKLEDSHGNVLSGEGNDLLGLCLRVVLCSGLYLRVNRGDTFFN